MTNDQIPMTKEDGLELVVKDRPVNYLPDMAAHFAAALAEPDPPRISRMARMEASGESIIGAAMKALNTLKPGIEWEATQLQTCSA